LNGGTAWKLIELLLSLVSAIPAFRQQIDDTDGDDHRSAHPTDHRLSALLSNPGRPNRASCIRSAEVRGAEALRQQRFAWCSRLPNSASSSNHDDSS
jgi:hypothetical protein